MAALNWLGGSYHQAVERREVRAVIRGVRCLEALLGGGCPELQRWLLLSVGCSQQWVFYGANMDLGCNSGRVMTSACRSALYPNGDNSTPPTVGGCSSRNQGGATGPCLEGSGFLSLLSFQLAIYMASVWWMQTLLWWKPRSGRQFLPSTSAWEAWTECPSECRGARGLSWGTWLLGRSFGRAGSRDAKAQPLSRHLEREIRSRGGRDKPVCR